MVEQPQPDPETQVGALAEVLAAHGVRYVVFGSIAGRLHGAELQTLDIVPESSSVNLARLADALNSLRPRRRTAETGEGMKIDGQLEARHFAGDTFAIGLIRLGYVDVVLHPKGFEAGYDALAPRAVVMRVGDSDIFVGNLEDLMRSKEQLNREKDRLHLPSLRRRAAEIRHESLAIRPPTDDRDLGPDLGM